MLNADSETYGAATRVLGEACRPDRAHSELVGGAEMEVCNAALEGVNVRVLAMISFHFVVVVMM